MSTASKTAGSRCFRPIVASVKRLQIAEELPLLDGVARDVPSGELGSGESDTSIGERPGDAEMCVPPQVEGDRVGEVGLTRLATLGSGFVAWPLVCGRSV